MNGGRTSRVLSTPGADGEARIDGKRLQTASRAFSFPYPEAYPIQIDLMQQIFRAIEDAKVGIFESPTGTGKSLSLICAAFSWLRLHSERELDATTVVDADGEPAWIVAYELKRRKEKLTRHETEIKERVQAMRQRLLATKAEETPHKRRRGEASNKGTEHEDDDDFIIQDQDVVTISSHTDDESAFLSPAVKALMDQLDGPSSGSSSESSKPFYARAKGEIIENDEPETAPKIIYASRTHSQLSQFVSELRKTSFGRSIDIIQTGSPQAQEEPVRNVSVGSRKQMCINADIQDIGARLGMEAMNEGCRELMKGGTKRKCGYLPPPNEAGQLQMLEYRDTAFTSVRDIEDLVDLGRKMEICPYFAVRGSARQAQLVTVPYNLLLQADARASLNITLEGSIVIIDEAHNLIDTILSINTISITAAQVEQAESQIRQYLRRFGSRLRGISEVNLKKLLGLLESLAQVCQEQTKALQRSQQKEITLTSASLVAMLGGNFDQVNLVELEHWLKGGQIARKVAGYADKRKEQDGDQKAVRQSTVSAMHTIEAFLLSLANQNDDGRVLLTLLGGGSLALKYQLLNPAESFDEIVSQARAVVLAGGTMEPISDFTSQLLSSVDKDRLVHYSCQHIIPANNLLTAVVCKGARGRESEFKYEARDDVDLLDDLTQSIANYCSVVPHGIVVFLPSYRFLEVLTERWKTTGGIARISSKKSVYYEPKLPTEVEAVLREYSTAASSTGAILFAVVGAKLSEGINFSDRLARAVVMVGMPFANSASTELKERMKYVRGLQGARTSTTPGKLTDPGQELYINLCMKAVNQSIGRAIRHQNDYAALILFDRRYGRKDIQDRLPAWIRSSVKCYDTFGPSVSALGNFFRDKKSRNVQ